MATKLKDQDHFDAYLGLGVAVTWWDLGRLLARREDDKALGEIAARVRPTLADYEAKAITLPRLREFATVVYDLLKTKSEGRKIGDKVSQRVAGSLEYDFHEEGAYLSANEPPDTFWANEYRLLFLDIEKPKEGTGWLNAAGTCKACGNFFIKSRRDQVYDTATCRMRIANREAYKRERDQRRRRRGRR
jgi:hypothetical protein